MAKKIIIDDELRYDSKKELITAIIMNNDRLLDEIMAAAGLQFIVPDDGIPNAIRNEKEILERFGGQKGENEKRTYQYAYWRKLTLENRIGHVYNDIVDLHNYPAGMSMAAERNPMSRLRNESWHDAVKNPPAINKRVIVRGVLSNPLNVPLQNIHEGTLVTGGFYEGVENMEDVWRLDLEIPDGCEFDVQQWRLDV